MRSSFIAWFIIITLVRPANAEETSSYYADKRYWQAVDWTNIEMSMLWRAPGWLAGSGMSTEAKRFFSKGRKLDLLGYRFNAVLGYEIGLPERKHFTTLSVDTMKEDCGHIASKLTSKFGIPVENDGTITIILDGQTHLRFLNLQWEWKVGSTRIRGACFGYESYKEGKFVAQDGYLMAVNYMSSEQSLPMTQKFLLSCSRNLTIDGVTEDSPDLVVWIDTYNGRALNEQLEILSDQNTFKSTNDEIRFSTTRNKITSEYTINRLGGTLNASLKQNSKLVATGFGSCEKVNLTKNKF